MILISFQFIHSSCILVLRLVEEVKLRASNCQLQNEDIYMNSTFQEFIQMCVRKMRGEDDEEELVVDYVSGCILVR